MVMLTQSIDSVWLCALENLSQMIQLLYAWIFAQHRLQPSVTRAIGPAL